MNVGADAYVIGLLRPSPGNCSSGASYADDSGRQQAFMVHEVNGTGGTAMEVPGTATSNTGRGASIRSVSCASPGNCSAVDVYITHSRSQAFVVKEG
jgi:hypothetical protein